MLLKNYFCCAVPVNIKMSSDDLRYLSALVADVCSMRASNGHSYFYFFPYIVSDVKLVQQLLYKYKIRGHVYRSHYNFFNQNVVRVRYKTREQFEVMQNFSDSILKYKESELSR